MIAMIAAPLRAQDETLIELVAVGALNCMVSAGKSGVDTSRFEKDHNWHKERDDSYSSLGMPVKVTFPADSDGISRICVVEATLPSKKKQDDLAKLIEAIFKAKPIVQKDSLIWLTGEPPAFKGLQFYLDKTNEQPEIRIIGAAF